MKVYVFLIQRAQDRAAWPVAYVDRTLAEKAFGRVSEIVELEMEKATEQPDGPR